MNDFVRASKLCREPLVAFIGRQSFERAPMKLPIGNMKFLVQRDNFETVIVGKPYLVTAEQTGQSRYNIEMRFFKVRPKDVSDSYWAAYWVRGKGMKVFGEYENFERDMLFLKMSAE